MNRFRAVLLLVLLATMTAIVTAFIYEEHSVVETRSVDMDLKVSDVMAFNTDIDALHFGKAKPGQVALRSFTLNNSYAFPLIVELRMDGELRTWASVDQNFIPLEPYTSRQLNISIDIPEDAELGLYTGKLTAIFRRAP